MQHQFLSISTAMLFTANFCFAQTSPDTSKSEPLQPVEVRSLRVGSNSPFVKTDLKTSDIERINLGQDLPMLLQYTPSAVVTSDAGNGVGYTGIRIRGTDGSRINVTLNGIPINDAESQGAYFVDLPDLASSTSSIQVQRGVGTSTNGVGSFGAAISINNLGQMQKAGAEGAFSFGSFNTQKFTVKAGTGLLQNGLQFDIRASQISSDGFIDRSNSKLQSLQFIAGWKANEKTSFRFMYTVGKEQTQQAWNGIPEEKLKGNATKLMEHYQNNVGVLYFTKQDSINLFSSDPRKYNSFLYSNQTDNYQQDYYQFFADHRFGKYLTGNVGLFLTYGRGYYEEYKYGQDFGDYGLNPFISGTDTLGSTDLVRQLWLNNKYYGAVFSLLYERNKTSLTLGGAYLRYEGYHYGFVKWAQYGVPNDYQWYNLNANKTEASVYVKAQQYFTDALIGTVDLQYRNVNYEINGFRKNPALRPEANYSFANPKIGLTYLLRSNNSERQKIYLSAAITNKEPNRDDFEASTKAAPKAERLTDIEGGYEINKRNWTFGANVYYMAYKDQLVLTGKVNDVGAYTRTNADRSHRAGIEQVASWKALWWLTLSDNITYSQNKINDFVEYIDDYDNGGQIEKKHGTTDIAFSPNINGALIASFIPFKNLKHGQGFNIDFANKYVGKQYLDNTSNDSRSIDAYYLADLRFIYTVALKPFRALSLNLAINNIFDRKYESNGYTYSYYYGATTTTQNFYFPQAGRNFMLGLNVKW